MAQILQMFSIVRCLYQPDVLPFAQLQAPSTLQRLRERYAFTQMLPSPAQLLATAGELNLSGSKPPVPIQQLSIGSNVIEFQVAGETATAEQFHQDVVKFLRSLSPQGHRQFPEYGKSIQTVAIATLDVPVEAILSKKMCNYLSEAATPAFRNQHAKPHVQLTHLQWTVTYASADSEVEYLPRPFTIEPRSGTRAGDNVYFTQSPTDSGTHRKLLERLESMLKQG